MKLTCIKSLWPEKEDFSIYRKDIGAQYIFVHMLTEGEIIVDGKWRKVEKGACFVSAPFTEQGVRACGSAVLHDWFHLEGEDVGDMLGKYGVLTNTVYYPHDDSAITHDVREAELAFLTRTPHTDALCALLIEILFVHIANDLSVAPKESAYLYRRFAELRSDILLHYDVPMSVEEMAQTLSLSPSRFHRLYKNYFGVSPARDLQNTRIEHAKLLLLQDGISVTEAAERLGYGSVYHFIRQFRERVGITPGEYKKR